ncbi:MAG: hypothetical protein GY944_02020, partial [bacterium]|nr:hypothetical protein [bacterium]
MNGVLRAGLLHAGGPYGLWSLAVLMLAENVNRKLLPSTGESLYSLQFARPSLKKLLPFGCAAAYLPSEAARPKREKWEARGVPAVVLGYAQLGALLLAPLVPLKAGTLKLVVSRDVSVSPAKFPMRGCFADRELTFRVPVVIADRARDPHDEHDDDEEDDDSDADSGLDRDVVRRRRRLVIVGSYADDVFAQTEALFGDDGASFPSTEPMDDRVSLDTEFVPGVVPETAPEQA